MDEDTQAAVLELAERAKVLFTRDEQPTVGTADWDTAARQWLADYEAVADQLPSGE